GGATPRVDGKEAGSQAIEPRLRSRRLRRRRDEGWRREDLGGCQLRNRLNQPIRGMWSRRRRQGWVSHELGRGRRSSEAAQQIRGRGVRDDGLERRERTVQVRGKAGGPGQQLRE